MFKIGSVSDLDKRSMGQRSKRPHVSNAIKVSFVNNIQLRPLKTGTAGKGFIRHKMGGKYRSPVK